jgi:hypothetical protein
MGKESHFLSLSGGEKGTVGLERRIGNHDIPRKAFPRKIATSARVTGMEGQ